MEGRSKDIKMFVEQFRRANLTLMVVQNDSMVYSSRDEGLLPLIDAIESGKGYLRNALVFDKVVGRAAALLFCHGKSRHVFADLMSVRALEIFDIYGIKYVYDLLVPHILNVDSTDLCPFEKLVEDVSDPEVGYRLISKELRLMQNN